MFKFSFLKKKEWVDVKDLHEKELFSPSRDWGIILAIFFLLVSTATVASLYIFAKVVREDVSVGQNQEYSQSNETINEARIKTSADFVRSRMNN